MAGLAGWPRAEVEGSGGHGYGLGEVGWCLQAGLGRVARARRRKPGGGQVAGDQRRGVIGWDLRPI